VQDGYEVMRKVGKGKYSEVFEGFRAGSDERCVIKILKPVKKKKVRFCFYNALLRWLSHFWPPVMGYGWNHKTETQGLPCSARLLYTNVYQSQLFLC